MLRRLDHVVVTIILAAVVVGSLVGERSHVRDVDEMVFRTTLANMQDGDGYYEAFRKAIEDKAGVAPTQVRSVRTPVLSTALAIFPAGAWRWLAAIPAIALCAAAAALAGPDLLARRLAAALAGIWMVVSLPLLYLHAELWGAALLVQAGLLFRRERDLGAALLCLSATAIRELFGIALLVGLVLGRDRRPWGAAIGVAIAGAALHAHWAEAILDPNGFDPPLHAYDAYTRFVAPGASVAAQITGVVLLIAAAMGFLLRRSDRAYVFLGLVTVPLVVGTALAGRAYWTLTWCGVTSAAAAVALTETARRLGWVRPGGDGVAAPYPRP